MIKNLVYSALILTLAFVAGQAQLMAQSAADVSESVSPISPHFSESLRASARARAAAGTVKPVASEAVESGLAQVKTYIFTTLDYPGADGSIAFDFNDGIAVGRFDNVDTETGLLFYSNSYHEFSVPGALTTEVTGINATGVIVGDYQPSGKIYGGFVFNGKVILGVGPAGAKDTFPASINDSGEIVGQYYDQSFNQHGFLYRNKVYTTIDYPGAKATVVAGINKDGTIVGTYTDSSNLIHGFQLEKGQFQSFDFPLAHYTVAESINDAGDIAGYFADAQNAYHGFVKNHDTFSQVDIPNAYATLLLHIKNTGHIIGYYEDDNGEVHGIMGR